MDRETYYSEISHNQGRILGFIKSMHFNGEEAKDILQDANITLVKKYKDFDPTKEFLPWAFAIARFTLLAHKKKRAVELKNLLYDSHVTNILLDKEDKALKWQINYDMEVERLRILDIGRKRLTNKQRFLLDSLLNGKTIQEIADESGCTYGAVQTLKFRTLNKIKDTVLKIKYSQSQHESATIEAAKEKARGGQQVQEEEGRDTLLEGERAIV